MNRSGRVTATQVARRSGVSQATVSYVLNNSPVHKISDDTRARVLKAAAELDYTPYEPARALASGASRVVLLVTPDFPGGHVVGELAAILGELLAQQGRTLLNHRVSSAIALSDVVAAVSPFAIISMVPLPTADRSAFELRGIAVEVIAFTDAAEGDDAEVVHPQQRIGHLQARHLLDRGHHRLAYALPDDRGSSLFFEPRRDGVLEECASAGEPAPESAVVPLDLQAAAEVVGSWHAAGVTAVCAYNDDVAIAVMGGAHSLGLAVPGDLAVIGVDDIPFAALVSPALTSVRLPVDAMAQELVRQLADGRAASAVQAVEPSGPVLIQRSSS